MDANAIIILVLVIAAFLAFAAQKNSEIFKDQEQEFRYRKLKQGVLDFYNFQHVEEIDQVLLNSREAYVLQEEERLVIIKAPCLTVYNCIITIHDHKGGHAKYTQPYHKIEIQDMVAHTCADIKKVYVISEKNMVHFVVKAFDEEMKPFRFYVISEDRLSNIDRIKIAFHKNKLKIEYFEYNKFLNYIKDNDEYKVLQALEQHFLFEASRIYL